MTLIELTVSMMVLIVAIGATLGSITSFSSLEQNNEATIRANVAARRALEALGDVDFRQVFALYNDEPRDDPGGFGTAPASGFAVAGLDPGQGDADGLAGQYLFPVDPAVPGVLREDRVAADFGLPRDLNADGVIDGVNRASDYIALPVRVRVEWTGAAGSGSVELQTLLIPR